MIKHLFILSLLFCSFFVFGIESEASYYEVLGVSNKAEAAEIKKAYRRQMKNYHSGQLPQGAAQELSDEKLSLINEAYSVLKNSELRRKYDRFLSHYKNVFHNDGIDFYFALDQAVSNYAQGFGRAVWFYMVYFMQEALNERQVHSILRVVVNAERHYEIVRRAAAAALENYVDQLFIEDIDLLLILRSFKNKIDDRGAAYRGLMNAFRRRVSGAQTSSAERNVDPPAPWNQNQIFQEGHVRGIGIKRRAERIIENWFKLQLQQPSSIDEMLRAAVDIDQKFEGLEFFRKKALSVFEENIQQLSRDQIDFLRKFDAVSYHSRSLKRQVRRMISNWMKLGGAKRTASAETEERRNLIRAESDRSFYTRDAELYGIKGSDESMEYLRSRPNLPSDRVRKIADYTLDFIDTFQRGVDFIQFINRAAPDYNKEALIEKTISYLGSLDDAHLFVSSLGGVLDPRHFDQILDQILPFIESQSGLQGGGRFLRYTAGDYIDEEHKKRMAAKLKNLPVRKPEDAEKFIEAAGKYLSDQDRREVLYRVYALPAQKCKALMRGKNA